MSTTVTMRPRRLSTPAISADDNGTRVSRSGMNTSCTREIGSPNNWPPIIAVTYSATVSWLAWAAWVLLVMLVSWVILGCPAQFGGLFLQGRDQPGPVELGDVVMEAGEPAALDRRRRHHRGQSDDRHRAKMLVGPDGFGKLEPVHVGHLDVGQHHVEDLARAQRGKALLRVRRHPHPVARGLEHRRQHVAEERAIIDQQHRLRRHRGAHLLAGEPVGERHREEVTDIDHFGGLALDYGGAENAFLGTGNLDVQLLLDDVDDL